MDNILLNGVSTHNLKQIDVSIPKNKITAIYGRSGAGKSSLAFSSLYAVCVDEFEALENGYSDLYQYNINNYQGIIPAVAISQSNKNNNPRSTLYSYLNLPNVLSSIKVTHPNFIPDFGELRIGSVKNECPCCVGLGEVSRILSSEMIISNCKILDNPFKLWKKGELADFYYQLLLTFCEQARIDIGKTFEQLTFEQQHLLLYGKSDQKLTCKFRFKKKLKTRKADFNGIMLYAQQTQKNLSDYSSKEDCPECHGARINRTLQVKVLFDEITMQQFLLMPFDELLRFTEKRTALKELRNIVQPIVEMGLGYLSLSRSVPSLSGGELQKLRFSRLLHSNISGVLIVIDEISSQLNEQDLPMIVGKLKNIAKQNTVVLVEHSPFMIKSADHCIHIGRYAGKRGGYVCEDEDIQAVRVDVRRTEPTQWIILNNLTKNNVVSQSIKLPEKALTVIMGVSGSGKSSLAKAIEERENAIYISQKNGQFSSRSVLASTLKLNQELAKFFAKKLGIEEEELLLHKNAGCRNCGGIGVIKYERGFEKDFYITCPSCNGKLFDETNEFIFEVVNGLSLFDCYQKEISELANYFPLKSKLAVTLNTLVALELGHLQLGRKTQTLSGGELRRVRLCEHFSKKSESKKILIIDEPIAGLDPETASKIAGFISSKTNLFKAIVVVEHRKEIRDFIDFEIVIGPQAGKNGGKILSSTLYPYKN